MNKVLLISLIAVSIKSFGVIVCEGETQMGPVKISYDEQSQVASVSGAALDKATAYNNVVDVWDGHATGLITAPGFAMKYSNWYGCIRNVEITTNIRSGGGVGFIGSFKVPVCRGGTTPDKLCVR